MQQQYRIVASPQQGVNGATARGCLDGSHRKAQNESLSGCTTPEKERQGDGSQGSTVRIQAGAREACVPLLGWHPALCLANDAVNASGITLYYLRHIIYS